MTNIATIFRALRRGVLAVVALAAAANSGDAGVAVVANRGSQPVTFLAVADGAPPATVTLAEGEARPVFATNNVRLRASGEPAGHEVLLNLGSAYYVSVDPMLRASQIPLGETPVASLATEADALPRPDAGVITVKILVDDNEYRPRSLWEPVIRQRVEKASAILQAHCGVRLQVTAVGTWDSEDVQGDFLKSLEEFERETTATPADLAIGFTSQYEVVRGRFHMGGTRGPLQKHILIKERAQNLLEVERLELLVHELGHFLGATHSPEQTSVMRPVLQPGQQRLAGARIQFDAANTLIMATLGEEIAKRRIRSLGDASANVRQRLHQIYAVLEPGMRDDPATSNMRQMLAGTGVVHLVDDTRRVLAELVRVAKLAPRAAAGAREDALAGDKLLEFYVRQAALAAKQVRRENGPRAMLMALGVAVDDPRSMAKIPLAGALLTRLEGAQQQESRIAVIGQPTIWGRVDLTRHFFVSALLAAMGGSDLALASGLAKEWSDAQGGSGFSFCDLAADEAGVAFAEAVLSGRISLDDVASHFTVEAFMPPVADLREGLQSADFCRQYGSVTDRRFLEERSRIVEQVRSLSGYKLPSASTRGQ